jgi:hypothetical protein
MSGRRFPGRDRTPPRTTSTTFQVEDIPYVEAKKLDPIERAAIERTVTEREVVIDDLQTGLVELRSERNALETQLSRVESECDTLRDRIRQLEAERPALEPKAVFTDLGSAIGDVQAELDGTNYTIGDVEFNLKANVVQSDEGLRMHLPSLDETFASANLSDIRFRVQADDTGSQASADYREIPDVGGLDRTEAERVLRQAGLSVGTVSVEDVAGARPDTVVSQFPEPYTLGEPDAPIDLTVAAEPPATESEADRLREEFELAIERAELDPESELAERLAAAGVDDLRALADQDPAYIASVTELPIGTVDALYDRLAERMRDEPVTDLDRIDGIGTTYLERLRAAGIETVAELATLDPRAVAEITETSTSRTKQWIEQARSMEE